MIVRFENGFSIAAGAAARPRVKRFMTSALPTKASSDDEIVDVEAVVVLGVGDRALQRLLHVEGDALARELQIGERALDLLAANELGQKIELLRRDAQHARDGLGLVFREPAAGYWASTSALASLRLFVRRVTVEGARRRKFAELMPDHVFADIDRNMLVPVVNAESQADELRQDRGAAAPDLDDFRATRCRARHPPS